MPAKQSHNARLKELADENNTNLYVSNLPKLINEDVSIALNLLDFAQCSIRK